MMARRSTLWFSLSAAAGLIVGLAWPPPPIPRAGAEAAEWSIPSAEELSRYSPEASSKITREMRWGNGALLADGTISDWRLAGLSNSSERAILVMDAKKTGEAKRISIGQPLPDGSILTVIDGDKITTRLDACERTYQLYQLNATSASAGCATEPSPDAPDKETGK